MKTLLALLVVLLVLPILAQQSTSYRLAEHTFNAGGHPSDGVVLSSASFRITLDALGDSVAGHAVTSASYQIEGNFVARYVPPGEVSNLSFADSSTLICFEIAFSDIS